MRISDWSSDVCSSDLVASPSTCQGYGKMRLFSHCPRVEFRSKSAKCDSYTIFLSGCGPIFGQNHARHDSHYSQRTLLLSIARTARATSAAPKIVPRHLLLTASRPLSGTPPTSPPTPSPTRTP